MTNFSDDRGAELRELFFETSQELLQALNEEALKLEKKPGDEEIVRSIRRTVHTLKGDSAACGLRELSELAHKFEDALSLDEAATTNPAVAEIAFASADIFVAMIAAYRTGGSLPSTENLSKRIEELTSGPAGKTSRRKTKNSAADILREDWTEAEKLAMARAQAQGQHVLHVAVKIDPHCAMPIAGRQLIQNALAGTGQILAQRPHPSSPTVPKQIVFVLASAMAAEDIAAKCKIPTIAEEVSVEAMLVPDADIEAARAAAPLPPTPSLENDRAGRPAPERDSTPSLPGSAVAPVLENILRVDAGRVDSVLNLVGELIIGKSMLQQALIEFSKHYPKEALRGKFADAMAFQARVLNDLQRSVMKMRMVPVDHLFRRFPRVVRDIALQCGRQAELAVSGQDTDLDKGILDAIAEPLTHMVRNAVSHGIETIEERRQAGKPLQGEVRLNAYHQGNQVIVEVSDDGRGMDAARIRAKAIDMGLVTAEDAARLTEAETLQFIFRPGFSTAEQITEVSGRGVGMDVVQSVLHRLKATVSVETRPGKGTTFRLKLPLTMAIIKALLFWVEQRLYAIPLNAVVEIARTEEAEVHQVDNYEVLQLRNQVLPVLRLGRPRPIHDHEQHRSHKLFVLVISVGEKKYGVIVDALEGEEELVIKALDGQTFSTDLVSGASILGDGRVVLILNLPAVVEHFARTRPQVPGTVSGGPLLTHADRMLLSLAAVGGGQ